MADGKKTLAHEWFEQVWNQGRAEMIDQLVSHDSVVHGLLDSSGNEIRGRDAFKPFHRSLRQAFPDLHIAVEDAVSEGDLIAARCVVRGTHHGDGLGVAPTGKAVRFTGMIFFRVRDGKIAEAWNNFDFEALRTQIGVGAD